MKFFLDTANLQEIKEAAALGILDGITTNPSLVAKEGMDFRELLQEIVQIVDGPISAEVVATDSEGMLREGRDLAQIHPSIVVKVPMMAEGLKALKALRADGIAVNVTLVFSAAQALLAAKGGATFVSPFIGRLDDIAETGMNLIRDIVQIYDNYDYPTDILVASVRNPVHVVEAAKAGADIATMPHKVFMQLLKHPLSDIGLENFLKDWQNAKRHELQYR